MHFDWIQKHLLTASRPLIIILGPTASGKTAFSIEIAKKFNAEIVSADSRQIYRHMDIGTDKIPIEKREEIPHRLIDIVNPDERFTSAEFKKTAEEAINDILRRGKLPVLAGGTGLYIRAIAENFSLPPENPALRAKLTDELNRFGKEHLHKKLEELDPANAAKIHPNNPRYVLRALEILLATGSPKNDKKSCPQYDVLQIGLRRPKETLFKRITERIDEQIRRGLVDETKKLLSMGYCRTLPSMSSLGYGEMARYLNNEMTLEQAVEELKKNTRNYAKRQMTWFKKDKSVRWLDF